MILALYGLLERAAHCIKRSGTIRLQPICPVVTHPESLIFVDEADHADPLSGVSRRTAGAVGFSRLRFSMSAPLSI